MRVVALLSGGKDSLFNTHLAIRDGHEVVAIANLKPTEQKLSTGDELDSYMYQTVGHQAIIHIADALQKPLFRADITGTTENKDLNYAVRDGNSASDKQSDEVEQLYTLLKDIRDTHGIQYEAVSVGAIASSYQRSRVMNICERLNLTMLAYLWDKDQDQLLQTMIDNKFNAILIKVACIGLDREHVGKSIIEMQPLLRKLNQEYQANICGEGGEYETLVLDCPMYRKRLQLDDYDIVCHSSDSFAPVYYMRPGKISLVDK